MTQQMEAELMFDHLEGRDLAIAELTKRGFDVEILDLVDEYEGIVLTPTVWIKVTGASELDDDRFFDWMKSIVDRFHGDVLEAGFSHPPAR